MKKLIMLFLTLFFFSLTVWSEPFPNLVRDIDNGTINLIGRTDPGSAAVVIENDLALSHRIRYIYSDINIKLSPEKRLNCNYPDKANPLIHGTYLYNKLTYTAITRLDKDHPIVVSGQFAGCTYKVFKDGSNIYAVHIYRDASESSGKAPTKEQVDDLVKLMDDYAKQKNWVEIDCIKTAGVDTGSKEKLALLVISELTSTGVDSILIGTNSTGEIKFRMRSNKPFK